MLNNKLAIILVAASISLLGGCGGGGSSGGSAATTPSSAVASSLSFPLQSAYKAMVANGMARYFTISGSCTGNGFVITAPAATAATFEGAAALSSATMLNMSLTNCTPASTAQYLTSYYDSNYVPLGTNTVGDDYIVYLAPPTIPASVTVGSSGTIGTETRYTDSTKTKGNGRDDLSYVIEADTSATAIVNLITKSYSASGTLILTEQNRYRIAATGALTDVSSDVQRADGFTMTMTFNVGGAVPVANVVATANAGSNIAVTVGSTATLDGSKSVNKNGIATTYSWSILQKPTGSNMSLVGAKTVNPTLTTDVVGTYYLQLIINDGFGDSAPSTMTVTAIPAGTISLGSSQADVSLIQGTPVGNAIPFTGAGYSRWTYDNIGITYIDISTTTNKVIDWQNYNGSLKVIMVPGSNVTTNTKISVGSTQDDVIRIQGTPVGYAIPFTGAGYSRWTYDNIGITYIDISTTTNKVIDWQNYNGSLKI